MRLQTYAWRRDHLPLERQMQPTEEQSRLELQILPVLSKLSGGTPEQITQRRQSWADSTGRRIRICARYAPREPRLGDAFACLASSLTLEKPVFSYFTNHNSFDSLLDRYRNSFAFPLFLFSSSLPLFHLLANLRKSLGRYISYVLKP